MRQEDVNRRLREELRVVQVSPALRQRTMDVARGKEKPYMKKKLSVAMVFALIAVLLCAAALAAAGRWGMLDFVKEYAGKRYIPQDAQDYVQTDVLEMENEWVTVRIRELYYDGRMARMTADVTPKGEHVLLVGEDVCLEDLFINLTHAYVMDGENDMRSVWQVIRDEGYTDVYAVNVSMLNAQEGMSGMIGGTMDYRLGEDGTLTIYTQDEYAEDLPERAARIAAIVMPYDQPLTQDGCASYAQRKEMEEGVTLRASVNPTEAPAGAEAIANVYVSEAPVLYPSVGVQVDRLLIEVKPQEIYATLEYTVVDREKYDALEGGLWFEYVNPDSEAEFPYDQRLMEGLSGGGSAFPTDGDLNTAVRYTQRETLGKNELHESYAVRAYSAWDKTRYETLCLKMRPATQADLEDKAN